MIILNSESDIPKFRSAFSKKCSIVANQENYVSIQCRHDISEQDLAIFRRLPGVAVAAKSNPVYFDQTTENPAHSPGIMPHLEHPSSPVKGFGFLRDEIKQSRHNCDISHVCSMNGQERDWGPRRMAADLLQKRIQEKGLRDPSVRTYIAVVDTGFDAAAIPFLTRPGTFRVRPGYDALRMGKGAKPVGDLTKDQIGHGTQVTMFIGGSNGMGTGPNSDLIFYRQTSDDLLPRQIIWSDVSLLSMKRACDENPDPDGLTIINLSQNYPEDEQGKIRMESDPAYQNLTKEFAQKGCLLVTSAGNKGIRLNDDAVNGAQLDNPILRVAATRASDDLTPFSSSGEVAAPGNDVYSIQSTSLALPGTEKGCDDNAQGGKPGTVVRTSGTSFSAPMTSGIIGEIVGVLKSGSKDKQTRFASLPTTERISLINRILKASMEGNSVNGLRASVLAERWRSGEGSNLPSVSEFQSWFLNPSAECNIPLEACHLKPNCSKLRTCFDQARIQLALCPNANGAIARNILISALSTARTESALMGLSHYLNSFQTKDTSEPRQELAEYILERSLFIQVPELTSWSKETSPERVQHESKKIAWKVDLESLLNIIPDYLAHASTLKDNNSKRRTRLLVGSLFKDQLVDILSRREETSIPGLNATLENVVEVVNHGRNIIGDQEIADILKNWSQQTMTEGGQKRKYYPRTVIAYKLGKPKLIAQARLIGGLLKNPALADAKSGSIVETLHDMEKTILEALDDPHFYFPDNPYSPDLAEARRGSEFYAPILKRHESELVAQAMKSDLSSISSVKIDYLLSNLERLWPAQQDQLDFAMKLINSYQDGTPWSQAEKKDFEDRSSAHVLKIAKTLPKPERKVLLNKLKELRTRQ